MKKQNYIIGSISSGTMREEDLIPCFVDVLKAFAQGVNREQYQECLEIEKRMEADDYYTSENANFDLEWLFDNLNDYAMEYFYFGSHLGNGSDYGFWLCENMEDDFDGLKVQDLSEVPKNYEGEILHITDHGNVSLYVKAKTQEPRVVWELV